jgi:2-dehydro-3-deoxyphosphogluconate aldolase/(4S)-4-hydroxy-2-oxoglutarate aldolase
MNIQTALSFIEAGGIAAGTRGAFPPKDAVHVASILMEYGINVFEMTMNSEQPIEAMQAIKAEFGDDACVGMGTVLDVVTAQRVLDAGADFIVSPAFQPEVVEFVNAAGVLMAPGVITPSEAVQAWSMGVKLLKLFPIGVLGLDYFKALFGPLNHLNIMCNGGMDADNAHELIKAGAVAVGMAGWLTGNGKPLADETLRHRAELLTNAVKSAKSGEPVQRTI